MVNGAYRGSNARLLEWDEWAKRKGMFSALLFLSIYIYKISVLFLTILAVWLLRKF